MTLDPRNAIVALFTNGIIAGTTEFGNKYVLVQLREDNMNATINTAATDQVGVILLEQIPRTTVTTISIGGKTVCDLVTIVANLWVVRREGMMNPDVFIKAILDAFENAIIDNHTDIDADTRVIQIDGIMTIPSESPELMRRAIMLSAWGYKVRP